MTNVEKLVDFINERDPSGKLFERFVAFLQLGLIAMESKEETASGETKKAGSMSKSVTEYGKEINDILSDTPCILQDLHDLIDLYMDFLSDLVGPTTEQSFQDLHRMAMLVLGCMRDKTVQIQADLERLEMVCDEMREAGA